MSFYEVTDTPVFGLLMTSSGFQSQNGQPYLHLAEVYVVYVP